MTTASFAILAPFAAWCGPLSEGPDEARALAVPRRRVRRS